MKEKREEVGFNRGPVPQGLCVYRLDGVYQKLCLCDYLRDLPEDPVAEAVEADKAASLSPSRHLPVGR
jgi:hypothetical protein